MSVQCGKDIRQRIMEYKTQLQKIIRENLSISEMLDSNQEKLDQMQESRVMMKGVARGPRQRLQDHGR